MQGLHLTADLFDCRGPRELLVNAELLHNLCEALTCQAGLTVVGAHFHAFGSGGGVTGSLLLAESHLAIHTWPELGAVTLDVYVCNFMGDNSAKATALMDGLVSRFDSARCVRHSLSRGQADPA
ncbi:MAG: adenosylmethionine decarboxylase [Aquabacterium sp.]|nr:MAG: adenosylmethionine decarboxylase [Aquabacterium sp.]